jgi:hypothetical protein
MFLAVYTQFAPNFSKTNRHWAKDSNYAPLKSLACTLQDIHQYLCNMQSVVSVKKFEWWILMTKYWQKSINFWLLWKIFLCSFFAQRFQFDIYANKTDFYCIVFTKTYVF